MSRIPAIFQRTGDARAPRFLRFSTEDQAVFSKRLALYLHAGVPILEALVALGKDARNRHVSFVIQSLSRSVMQGQTLSTGLESFERSVGGFSISLIRVGESSGTLHETLAYLAQVLKKRKALRRKITGALIYPLIVILATLLISSFLALYAFPKIIPLFRGFHAALPLPTRILIFISDSVALHAFPILFGIVGFILLTWRLMRIPRVAQWRDRTLLELPFLGAVFKAYYLATISQTLATLLASGVRILPALHQAARIASNRTYQEAIAAAAEQVASGSRLAGALGTAPLCFPSMVIQMIGTGESTGTLSESFESLAEQYEEELDDMSVRLTALIEPVLMIVMGLIVGFVALAIITPVYRITQDMTL